MRVKRGAKENYDGLNSGQSLTGKTKTASGLQIIILYALGSIFFSCSHRVSKSLPLEEVRKRICLTGHGKGKLWVDGKRYFFSYESKMEKKGFTLVLDFPLYGEEVLFFKREGDKFIPPKTVSLKGTEEFARFLSIMVSGEKEVKLNYQTDFWRPIKGLFTRQKISFNLSSERVVLELFVKSCEKLR